MASLLVDKCGTPNYVVRVECRRNLIGFGNDYCAVSLQIQNVCIVSIVVLAPDADTNEGTVI
jgi:hypothetical protein